MAELQLHLMGSPNIVLNNTSIDISRRKAVALLAYLALAAEPQRRDRLATIFWPEYDDSKALAYLRRTLWSLKQALGDDWLDVQRDTIALKKSADLWLDVTHFRQLQAEAQTDPENAISTLTTAANLYRADFLAGFSLIDASEFDEWQFFQAESLRQEFAVVLETLLQVNRQLGDLDSAIRYARRWLALDPLHEPAQQALMQSYAQAGQQSAALRQYQECVRLFETEFGTSPSAETTALYEAIKQKTLPQLEKSSGTQETGLGNEIKIPIVNTATAPTSPPSPPAPPPFVARERELNQLNQYLNAALNGDGAVVFVTGDAGYGKSTLLGEFARRAQEAHANLIVANGYSNAYAGFGDPYLPFRDVLEMLSGDAQPRQCCDIVSPDHTRRLQALLPDTVQALIEDGPNLLDICVSSSALLSRVASLGYSQWLKPLEALMKGSQTTSVEAHDLFEQYSRVLHRLAATHPLLITLDDLQWADVASLGLLFHLGRRLTSAPILIVGAYRLDEVALGRNGQRHPLEKIVTEFKRNFGDIQVDLADPDATEGRSFIDAYLDVRPNRLDEKFREALLQHTGGHALFTVELLRAMRTRGAITQDAGGYWVENESLDWQQLPARVEGVIEERIARLTPEQHELLAIASVEGVEFTAQVLARVQQLDERQTLRILSQELTTRHRLIREQEPILSNSHTLAPYQFNHFLFQQYLYHSLSSAERRLLHHQVAKALEALHQHQMESIVVQLAHHYVAAGRPQEAIPHLLTAGSQARRSAALDEAVRFYQSALTYWPPDQTAEQAKTLMLLGETQMILGQLPEAQESMLASCHLFETLQDRRGASTVYRLMGRLYWEQTNKKASLKCYRTALSILEEEPECVELAQAMSSISQMHMLASEYDQAIAWGERALEIARRLNADEVLAAILNNTGCAYSSLGDPELGLAMLEESIHCAAKLGLHHDQGRAYFNLGDILIFNGRIAEGREMFETLESFATRLHAGLFRSVARIILARIDWQVGHWTQALARYRQLEVEEAELLHLGRAQIYISQLLGTMANDLGQPQVAIAEIDEGVTIARTFQEIQTIAPLLAELIRAYAALKQPEQALLVVEELCIRVDQAAYYDHGVPMALLTAARWLAKPENNTHLKKAQACVEHLEHAHQQFGNIFSAITTNEGRAYVAVARQDLEQAIDQFQRAVSGWESMGQPYDQMRALIGLAGAFKLKGDDVAARTSADQAKSIATAFANQLTDEGLKSSFLASDLVRQLYDDRY